MSLNNFNVNKIRSDFPILKREVNGKPLIYLDNAATSQKPNVVIEAINEFYRERNANVHRSVHALGEEATQAYEHTRKMVQQFINAASEKEIIFVRGATEGINLVAQSYVKTFLKKDDEILITGLEHHSNIVPWQLLRDQMGIVLKVAPVNEAGEIILERFNEMLSPRTKFVAMGHVSNAIGTINPVAEMIAAAKKVGAVTLVDGCQATPHLHVDVQRLGCDFYTFSSHKMCGPTGIGALYGRMELLEKMPPYQGGGEMIREVRFDKTTFADVPYKFEAGTPNFADAVGFGAAIEYLQKIGIPNIVDYEHELTTYLHKKAAEVDGLRVIGQAKNKIPILSFVIDRTHPNDIGTLLDQLGIAVRTGHHCAMPLMQRYAIPGTVRASLSFINTKEEIDALFAGIERVKRILIEPEPVPMTVKSEEKKEDKSSGKKVVARKLPKNPNPIDVEILRGKIIDTLRTIYDPEIPVNIYDLGLIYDVNVDKNGFVKVKMTLTAPGCPVAQTFPGEVQGKVQSVKDVAEAEVELVWEPPWTKEKMSEAAKLELGMF
jgi:cysteine desulfurase/selenocysteine lyase